MDTCSTNLPPATRRAQPIAIDLNAVVSGLHSRLLTAVKKDVALTLTLAAGIHPVRVDRAQFERLVLALVVNAAEAMDGCGPVAVETRIVTLATEMAQRGASLQPGRYFVIAVTDTGRGMTPEVRKRLFDPLFSTKSGGKGAGCGLSTCDTIVQAAGGLIFADSELGAGTAFTVLLPVAERIVASAAAELRGDQTILLIDDSVGVRTLVRRILERLGYQVHEAASGKEALAIVDALAAPIDLVLCDVILPDSTGAEVVRQIQGRVPQARSMFMSGHTPHTLSPRDHLPDGAAFIQKPFERVAFAQQIREVLCG